MVKKLLKDRVTAVFKRIREVRARYIFDAQMIKLIFLRSKRGFDVSEAFLAGNLGIE